MLLLNASEVRKVFPMMDAIESDKTVVSAVFAEADRGPGADKL